MKRYELQGIENYDYICDFCGKKHISRCFVVLDKEAGEIKRFGSSCIVKALGVPMSEIKAEAQRKVFEIHSEYAERLYEIWLETSAIMKAYRKDHNYPIGFLPDTEARYWELCKEENRLNREYLDRSSKFIF